MSSHQKSQKKWWVISIPYLWLLVLFCIPFLILVYISFVNMGSSITPFKPLWDSASGVLNLKYENYWSIFLDPKSEGNWWSGLFQTSYIHSYWLSIRYAFLTTLFCLMLGYPFAYFIARCPPTVRPALLLLVMLPFWTSFLLRVFAWKGILADRGYLNQIFMFLTGADAPYLLVPSDFSMMIGMVYVYLPFMVLPLYANLVKMDFHLLEAAYDLGCTPWKAFWLITVPLSKAGIIAGSMLVFIPATGEFVIPSLLGGADNMTIGFAVYDQIFTANNWPRGSALAVTMMLLILLPLALYYKYSGDKKAVLRSSS
jgi:putrescine transport system permease protein